VFQRSILLSVFPWLPHVSWAAAWVSIDTVSLQSLWWVCWRVDVVYVLVYTGRSLQTPVSPWLWCLPGHLWCPLVPAFSAYMPVEQSNAGKQLNNQAVQIKEFDFLSKIVFELYFSIYWFIFLLQIFYYLLNFITPSFKWTLRSVSFFTINNTIHIHKMFKSYNKLELWVTKGYHSSPFISLEICPDWIILLHAHSQVVYYNCVKFNQYRSIC